MAQNREDYEKELLVPGFNKKEIQSIIQEAIDKGIVTVPSGGTKLYRHIVSISDEDTHSLTLIFINTHKEAYTFNELFINNTPLKPSNVISFNVVEYTDDADLHELIVNGCYVYGTEILIQAYDLFDQGHLNLVLNLQNYDNDSYSDTVTPL